MSAELKGTESTADLSALDIESLEISEFLDDNRLEDSEVVAKVMSASCTTCECCCSCSS
jgi:thiazolylpeptide-type bacteriocin precursor